MKKSLRRKKWFAWIGMMCAIALFFVAAIGSICFYELDFYDYSEEEYRRILFERVADQYSIRALCELAEEKMLSEEQIVSRTASMENTIKEHLLEQNFRYGIIKAESLEDMDLTDKSIYETWNDGFFEEVSSGQQYVYCQTVRNGETYYYADSLWTFRNTRGMALDSLVMEERKSVEIDDVVYDIENGVFYYQTDAGFFPVQNLTMETILEATGEEFTCNLRYDFEKNKYLNLDYISPAYWAFELEKLEGEFLTQEYPSLLGLEEGHIGGVRWLSITLDEIFGYTASNFNMVGNGNAIYDEIQSEAAYAYQALADGEAVVEYAPRETTYFVVSVLPKEAGFGFSGNMFTQANTIITVGYGLRYSIYLVLVGLFVLMIGNFSYLISVAGKREGTDEIIITGFNKLPLGLYIAGASLLGAVLCETAGFMLEELEYYPIPRVLTASVLLLCACVVAIRLLLGLAVRMKKGEWWKNTLTYRGVCIIKKILEVCVRQFSLLWKVFFAAAALTLLDMVCVYGFFRGSAFYMMGKRVVFTVVIFWIALQMERLRKGGEKIAAGDLRYQIDTSRMFWEFQKHGENLNSIRDGISHAVEERMKSERFKTELITNVSHDIKTPLTSIINYVDLLEKEELQNETAKEYLEVLERQSTRLKKLIEDLIEASKASTGSLNLSLEELDAGIFLVQTVGEFEEKLQARNLELRMAKPDQPVRIIADSRHLWRVIDNLMNNICKYAQPQTRVYINIEETESKVMLIFRNTSYCELNIKSDELMERFVRGDSSRNTEGNGLGLSIARSLMELMGGKFELQIDGDLFKVVLIFVNIKNI